MNNKLLANAIKVFRGWPLPVKIIISIVALIAILQQVSRFNYYRLQQNTKENTTPHKQTVDITKIPSEVKAFLSDENLQKMDEAGMNIYTGDNPPNIEGTYIFKNLVVKYDPKGYIFNVIPETFTLKDQKANTVNLAVTGKDETGREYSESGRGVIISGEGNCFSVYLENSISLGKECKSKSVEIISACKKESGLIDMDEGTIWTDVNNKCTADEHVPAGYIRIFSHKSLAPKVK